MKPTRLATIGLVAMLLGCGRPAAAPRPATVPAPAGAGAGVAYLAPQKLGMRSTPDGKVVFTFGPFDTWALAPLRDMAKQDESHWQKYFIVTTQSMRGLGAPPPTPMLGDYTLEGNTLEFKPRFPLAPGATVYAYADMNGQLPSTFELRSRGEPVFSLISQTLTLPKPAVDEDTRITAVYPSADLVPENLLKFYIHFSGPMSRGQAYDCIHLFDESGKEVESPFLELGEELWDRTGQRFTLFLDPGRVKRELLPRQELGPVLVEGKAYTLVVEAKWLDAKGNPLVKPFRKTLKVGPPDDRIPEMNSWRVSVPPTGSREPVVVDFPEPLDHALLERVLRIKSADGHSVVGAIQIQNAERRWSFTPEQPWAPGTYQLEAETIVEDLAGNNLSRPFELDLLRPVERETQVPVQSLRFEVK